jgi:PAS domain-containing protein
MVRVVCSYCRRLIRADPGSRVTDVSHGMCEPCAVHFDRLWSGMPLDEFLDGLSGPALVVDEDTRVITVNKQLADLVGVERGSVVGLLGGEALACVRARTAEGCGRTARCRECGIRRTVEQVARTGQMRESVAASVDTDRGRVALRISGRPCVGGSVQVTIEQMGEPRARAG